MVTLEWNGLGCVVFSNDCTVLVKCFVRIDTVLAWFLVLHAL